VTDEGETPAVAYTTLQMRRAVKLHRDVMQRFVKRARQRQVILGVIATHQRRQDQGNGERRHSVPHTHPE